jgi:hypothetical protein
MNSISDHEREQQQEREREMRKALVPYLEKWVKVQGVFRAFGTPARCSRVTALCDVQLIEEDGTRTELGHCWIQHAAALHRLNPLPGDSFTAECKVGKYRKRLDSPDEHGRMAVEDYNLTYMRHLSFDHESLKKGEVMTGSLNEGVAVVNGSTARTMTVDGSNATQLLNATGNEIDSCDRDALLNTDEGEESGWEPTGIEIVKVKEALKGEGVTLVEALMYLPPLIGLSALAGSPKKLECILTRLEQILA